MDNRNRNAYNDISSLNKSRGEEENESNDFSVIPIDFKNPIPWDYSCVMGNDHSIIFSSWEDLF